MTADMLQVRSPTFAHAAPATTFGPIRRYAKLTHPTSRLEVAIPASHHPVHSKRRDGLKTPIAISGVHQRDVEKNILPANSMRQTEPDYEPSPITNKPDECSLRNKISVQSTAFRNLKPSCTVIPSTPAPMVDSIVTRSEKSTSDASSGSINSSWTSLDDEKLIQARAHRLNWNQISPKHFPDRTANACRKRHERLTERQNVKQ
jgi:hypothetical protein